MSSNTINLSDEAFERLNKWKKEDESYSSVILRVLPKFRDISKILEGSEYDLTEEEGERLKQEIRE
ncbi:MULTISPECIES: DUF7557 family protein [Methanoplanus]|uniref:Antitoxin n=2 Tax=Methanoplanus TaxID=2314 RepID=H1Z077_9EURY|nr:MULTISPECIES: antitoxin VapB family protein [Methanoplanus]EHQ36169.1 hypothetical protein Metlim_2084 [Methanoplanus limicola DSM 2279]UUX92546.1 hypothetical protein L6E24_00005 [Methanoplanus endosymbiosus]